MVDVAIAEILITYDEVFVGWIVNIISNSFFKGRLFVVNRAYIT
ncbi:hypothetical protein NDK25_09530 [Niallia taxi]|nr:hypothetical protein [Niallia taxi]MDE5052495.1 hypothetical protein [Niallia taxi]